jgi:uncharacterized protein YecE (DUF72 family)
VSSKRTTASTDGAASSASPTIRVGIGGWTFAPWRGVFYPEGLPHAQELRYAAGQLTAIEINGTFYRTQTPATFRKWASEVPDGFVFSLKGPRYATNRRVLAEAGESIERFIDSGLLELGDRLGPLLWQFAPTKKFEEADFGAFLELLPRERDGRRLRHVVEVRHPSFVTPAFIALLRSFEVPAVYTDHVTYPNIADVVGDFVYARLQQGEDDIPTAYPAPALAAWTKRARTWAVGERPSDLPLADPGHAPPRQLREVFVFFIHEGKVRAPAAAMALIKRLNAS